MDSLGDLKKWLWDARVEWIRTGELTKMSVDTPTEFAHWMDLMVAAQMPFGMGIDDDKYVWLAPEGVTYFSMVYTRE